MDLSIIIVNYNVKEFLQNLILSIHKASKGLNTEIIIVDNASQDNSVEYLRKNHPEVKLIASDINLGFGKANNIGLKIATGKYLLILNPDTIVSENTFTEMISFLEKNPQAGLAGCKLIGPEGNLQLACKRSFPSPWTSFCKFTGLSSLFPKSRFFARYNLTYLDENQTHEVDAIAGAFMMMDRKVYEKVGGFDEDYFMYGEDLDLCYRIQKAGYKIYYVHTTSVIHYKGESTKRSSFDETKFFYNAMHIFVKKHLSHSFLMSIMLQFAITARRILAFAEKRKLLLTSIILDFIFFDLSIKSAELFRLHFTHWSGFVRGHVPVIYLLPALIQILTGVVMGVYKSKTLSVLKSFASLIISFFIITSLTFFFKEFEYSRSLILMTYIAAFFSFAIWRAILKLLFKVGVETGLSTKNTLIVGTGKAAVELKNKLRSRKNELFSIAGFITLNPREMDETIDGTKIIGSLDNLPKVIIEAKINKVIFSSEEISYSQMMATVARCQNENVEFKLAGNNLDMLVGKSSVSVLEDTPLIDLNYNSADPVIRLIKRLFDLSVGFFTLLFIYPLIYLSILFNKKKTDFKEFILGVPGVISGRATFVGQKNPGEAETMPGRKGLTGLWYLEENASQSEIEKLDIYYAKNQNIWIDLEILGKSLTKMLNKRY